MRVSTLSVAIATLIATSTAFSITSPTLGQKLDPTQPITFSWTFNSTDPASFDIYLNQPGGLTSMSQIATGVSTFAYSYIVPAGQVKSYGVNYTLIAQASGVELAMSPNFTLSMASASSSTYTGSVTGGVASVSAASSGSGSGSASATTTGGSAASSQATSGMTSATGSNSFTTSTVSRSESSTGTSASSSAASATSSQNAQPKLGSSGSSLAFGAAGLIAGLAALMA